MTYGIYKILNTITNDFYIGSTIQSFKARKSKHYSTYYKYKNEGGRKQHPVLYNAFDKYGIENFEFIELYKFNKRKVNTREIILKFEERLIERLKPKYNVCLKPTLGGSPNLGRKLDDSWKKNIAIKSSQYRHDEDTLNKVTINNKLNASRYRINDEFEGSLLECANHYNVDIGTILNRLNNKYNSKIIKSVVLIKTQRKSITLFLPEEKTFKSYSECDKYLNMWRGFTSTNVLKKEPFLLNYKYVINDIV